MNERIAYTGITFDDVLLEPGYSEIVPAEVSVATRLTRGIKLNIPLLGSPMDTVTESNMAIALAQQGGLGVIHKNMSIDRQTEEVDMVKRSANGIIVDPVTLPPDASVETARKLMDQHNISGVPVTDSDRQLQGILTRRDLRFLEGSDLKIQEVMTCENLVTATGTVTLAEAEKILMAKKVEKLLLVDEDYRLTGLITIKDVDMMKSFPNACKDSQGRLRVGGAVGVHDYERAESLMRQESTCWSWIVPTDIRPTSLRLFARLRKDGKLMSLLAMSPLPMVAGTWWMQEPMRSKWVSDTVQSARRGTSLEWKFHR